MNNTVLQDFAEALQMVEGDRAAAADLAGAGVRHARRPAQVDHGHLAASATRD